MSENPSDTYNDDRYSMSSFPNPGILAHCNDFHILPSEIIITFASHSIIIPTKTHSVMNDLQIIQSKIYELRGQKVMLDFDLANLYGVETSQLKRAVRRNIERFEGDDFMFEITHDEFLRCQIGTSNGRGGTRYIPFAFTKTLQCYQAWRETHLHKICVLLHPDSPLLFILFHQRDNAF